MIAERDKYKRIRFAGFGSKGRVKSTFLVHSRLESPLDDLVWRTVVGEGAKEDNVVNVSCGFSTEMANCYA